MFMVYWSVIDAGADTPYAQSFSDADMVGAMALMEQLRVRQRAGDAIRFVTMSSENPDSVGNPGVDAPGPGYKWTKRRHRW